jgi:hypothetical protein
MDSAKEDELCPQAEYDLEVISATTGKSKSSGKPMITVVMRISDPPEDIALAAPVFHYITLPIDEDVAAEHSVEPDDLETAQRKLRDIRRFLVCFGIAFTSEGFSDEDLLGAAGNCMVTQEEAPGIGMQHKLQLPRATDEAAERLMGSGGGKGRGKGKRARA